MCRLGCPLLCALALALGAQAHVIAPLAAPFSSSSSTLGDALDTMPAPAYQHALEPRGGETCRCYSCLEETLMSLLLQLLALTRPLYGSLSIRTSVTSLHSPGLALLIARRSSLHRTPGEPHTAPAAVGGTVTISVFQGAPRSRTLSNGKQLILGTFATHRFDDDRDSVPCLAHVHTHALADDVD